MLSITRLAISKQCASALRMPPSRQWQMKLPSASRSIKTSTMLLQRQHAPAYTHKHNSTLDGQKSVATASSSNNFFHNHNHGHHGYAHTQRNDENHDTHGHLPKKDWKAKIKHVFVQYGKVAVCWHTLVYCTTFASIYAGISAGVDITSLMKAAGMEDYLESLQPHHGVLFASYIVTQLTGPARGVFTVVSTPVVARTLKKLRTRATGTK
eukprot:Colp12_sorted_trinity150504_noHs@6363